MFYLANKENCNNNGYKSSFSLMHRLHFHLKILFKKFRTTSYNLPRKNFK